ncbi:sensor histidine kinase [Naasia lichenicola]|uniref:sensor histidine kinase n=1 Tax=Naasia lichenicola TaxID=2565933 RepID=UPI001E5531A3|nr:ATP-binding protein [Naasia lichenicola]
MRRGRSLRLQIVLIVVGLLASVGLVIGLVSVLVLQSYLVGKLDQSLTSAASRSQGAFGPRDGDFPSRPDGDGEGFIDAPGQGAGTVVASISSGAVQTSGYVDDSGRRQTLTTEQEDVVLGIAADGVVRTYDLGGELGTYRMIAVERDDGSTIVTGLPLSAVEATVSQLALVVVLVTSAGLVLAGAAAAFIVDVALRPLHRVASTAASVTELPLDRGDVDLSIRVPQRDIDPTTEVGQVGFALNRLLGHVGSALAARKRSEDKVRQFVADASHELRTPLASIRGYSELTRRTQRDLPPEVEHSLGRIESEAIRMTSLVEDLLLLARLDSQPELRAEEVDLSIIAVEAVGDAHVAGPDHEWVLDLPDEPVTVIGDDPRLRQVLVNLLANARVHTPAGTTVTTSIQRTTDGTVTMRVSDDGPGIDPALAETLFERFARGDSSRNRATGSTGLGLSIVRAVVEAHGGQVMVSSEPGDTVFIVRIPPRATMAPAVEATADPSTHAELGAPGLPRSSKAPASSA